AVESFLFEPRVAVQEVLSLTQGTAEGLVVVKQTVEICERERPAGGRVDARRRAGDRDRAAVHERQRDRFMQRQTALQEYERRGQRLGPPGQPVVLDKRFEV